VSETARFEQDPATVFAALTDPERLAAWHHGFDGAERLDEGPLAVGSRLRLTARVDGRPATLDVEVVELEPSRRLQLRAASDDVRSLATLTVREVEGGCEVTASSGASVDDEPDAGGPEPAANPAFADLGSSLLDGLRAAVADDPLEPR
jgi:uncharacterized protein YndB with AHSA1/START domain